MTQHPHPPPRQQWPVLYLGERGTGGSGLSWRTTALWAEALPRTQSFPTLECSNFSHIKDWLVVSSSPQWRCALTLGGYNRTPHRNGSFLVESGDRNPTDKMGEGAAHCGTLTSQGRAVVRCGAGLYNTGLVRILPPSRRYKRRLPSDTAKCPMPGQNGPPASYNTDPSMEKHLRKQAC